MTRSPLYNWLEYLPFVVMAVIIVAIWKPAKLRREVAEHPA
ncbi:MAG: hypothetical protein ACYCZF_06890 [Anaerolineae bacterium]